MGRALNKEDERITLATKLDIDDITQKDIEKHLEDSEFKGIFAIQGKLTNPSNISNIIKNNKVYLADIVSNVIKDEQNLSGDVQIEVQSPFWYIEK
jgi:hypothetical protein